MDFEYHYVAIRGRLKVGRVTLNHLIGVRIPAPEPCKKPLLAVFCCGQRLGYELPAEIIQQFRDSIQVLFRLILRTSICHDNGIDY